MMRRVIVTGAKALSRPAAPARSITTGTRKIVSAAPANPVANSIPASARSVAMSTPSAVSANSAPASNALKMYRDLLKTPAQQTKTNHVTAGAIETTTTTTTTTRAAITTSATTAESVAEHVQTPETTDIRMDTEEAATRLINETFDLLLKRINSVPNQELIKILRKHFTSKTVLYVRALFIHSTDEAGNVSLHTYNNLKWLFRTALGAIVLYSIVKKLNNKQSAEYAKLEAMEKELTVFIEQATAVITSQENKLKKDKKDAAMHSDTLNYFITKANHLDELIKLLDGVLEASHEETLVVEKLLDLRHSVKALFTDKDVLQLHEIAEHGDEKQQKIAYEILDRIDEQGRNPRKLRAKLLRELQDVTYKKEVAAKKVENDQGSIEQLTNEIQVLHKGPIKAKNAQLAEVKEHKADIDTMAKYVAYTAKSWFMYFADTACAGVNSYLGTTDSNAPAREPMTPPVR